MDVLKYFDLKEQPFRIGPDPRFLYLSDQVQETLAKCEYMAKERIGPLYINGPVGGGKTSILRRLYETLSADERYKVTMLISPNVKTSNAFLRIILETFDVPTWRSYDQSLKNFENFLLDQYQLDKIPVLLIDEAQNLTRDCLKLIHYLLNFETATVKLLQIVLVGQEELAEKVLRYKELASRMFPAAINPMSAAKLADMIRFRWMVAGAKSPPPITENAYKTLFAYSKGLPRDALKVLDEVLRDLVVKEKKSAGAEDIEHIAKELNLSL